MPRRSFTHALIALSLMACGDDAQGPAGSGGAGEDGAVDGRNIRLMPPQAGRDGGGGGGDGGAAAGGGTGGESGGGGSGGVDASSGAGGDAGAPGQQLALPAPQLRSPADGATELEPRGELCWEPVDLPDGVAADAVRYSVYIDDMRLSVGKVGMEGFEGPCTGMLDFNFEQSYRWRVVAFEVARPDNQSDSSESWSFTVREDGQTRTLFADNFESDGGWTVSGDAAQGHWTRGVPELASHRNTSLGTDFVSQPGRCAAGDGCFFTGHNPGGRPSMEDVAGGSTVLLSPVFDMSGVQGATVSLSRFFYRSAVNEGGAFMRVELLVTDGAGERAFVLEELSQAGTSTNLWSPLTYSTCGVPLASNVRLRITATDVGSGVLEGAIDSVVVTGYAQADPCEPGVGALCDPKNASSCGPDLRCCAQGNVNTGVYRCEEPVPSVDWSSPPASPAADNNGPLGCNAPDLFVRPDMLGTSVQEGYFTAEDCAVHEGCVGGTGWRTLLRFNTSTPNIGSRDLVMGVPSNHPELFTYSACHDHFHFDNYAVYTLLDQSGAVAAAGHKQAFCLLDWSSWAWPYLDEEDDAQYTCYNQGISRGWQDVYSSELDCQWVDITGVPAGTYTLRIEVNAPPDGSDTPLLVERNYDNNVLEAQVRIP